jgi:putative transcriptional regulator
MKQREVVTSRVEIHRRRLGLTQEALGDLVGVTRQTIIAIERGNYVPSLLLAMKIAQLFLVPIEEVFSL